MKKLFFGLAMLASMSSFADSSFELLGTIEKTGESCSVTMEDRMHDFESFTMTYSSPSQIFSEVYGMTLKSLEVGSTTSNRYKEEDNQYAIRTGGASLIPIGASTRFKYQLQENRFEVEKNYIINFFAEKLFKTREVCVLDL